MNRRRNPFDGLPTRNRFPESISRHVQQINFLIRKWSRWWTGSLFDRRRRAGVIGFVGAGPRQVTALNLVQMGPEFHQEHQLLSALPAHHSFDFSYSLTKNVPNSRIEEEQAFQTRLLSPTAEHFACRTLAVSVPESWTTQSPFPRAGCSRNFNYGKSFILFH